ncbi:MAG TPA: membrane protein insertase YidC [Chthoniobacterales bacterium]
MDRKTWLAVALSVIGLILWHFLYNVPEAERLNAQRAAHQAATVAEAAAPPSATPTPALPAPEAPVMARRSQALTSEDSEYLFQNDTGGIEQVVLLKHEDEATGKVTLNADKDMPIGAYGLLPGQVLGGFEMSVDEKTNTVIFQKTEADGLLIEKRFSLPPPDDKKGRYTVNLEVHFRNPTQAEIVRAGYFIATGGAASIHVNDLPTYTRFDWYRDGKMSGIDVNWFNPGQIPLIGIQTSPAKLLYEQSTDQIAWAAVASQYFCTIVTAAPPEGAQVWARRFNTYRKSGNTDIQGIQGGLGLKGFSLPAGQERVEKFQIYAGPKEYAVLSKLNPGQKDVINFGFFGFVSEFLLWAMHGLHRALWQSYAAAIIALTILIKLCLWPLQNIATNSMRRMAALAPKMTELREKYKDDPQKMNQETMKLYRDYGINPFSGCLPMLIQIPIFFGFYTMLGTAVELRDSSFLWIQDLSQPDTIAHLFGFPINLLPLIMAVTMVWQMAITPKTGDAVQQRIFYFMPVIFLVFCYNYASGLALYWTTQNIFSIVQLYMTRNKPLPVLEKKSVIAKREATLTKKKKRK